MKILPETPSLDFLRREAKDLLAVLRENDASVTLSDAQRTLAERYGFRSWTELKAEVERRRAADASVDQQLGAELAEAFGLGTPVAPMSQLAWSQTGEDWKLQTDAGTWRVRTILDWITPQMLEDAARLREAAIARGMVAPVPVRSPGGSLVESVQGKRWCADVWLDVGPEPVKPASEEVARGVGRILGTLHSTALPATGPVNPWLTQRRTPDQWHRIADTVRASGAEWATALDDALVHIVDLTAIETPQTDEEPILCICDLSVRTCGDSLAVTHWDFSGSFLRSMELASVLSSWSVAPDGAPDERAVRALVDGYRSVSGYVPTLTLGSFVADIAAWLNWTAGRISGALQGPDPEWRRREVLELRGLLARPRTRDHYLRILAALA
ncbi:MAG TPA: phosphotransferase [Actinomycetota bacterium]|nr:phosphotransferase [Actinomycetota bacterium]